MDILARLKNEPMRKMLIKHSLLERMKHEELKEEQILLILGQWWHPLHYFPNFISRLISICPTLEMKTTLSKILWQELGEGNITRAHEEIFITTMKDVGLKPSSFDEEPLKQTEELLTGYYYASDNNYLQGLGFIFGTEVADLAMVASIGKAVSRYTNTKNLPWVDIHIEQEPDHQASVDNALTANLTSEDKEIIIENAKNMWERWINFFSGIEQRMDVLASV